MQERPRPFAPLRCAYCHDALSADGARSCDGCGTLLHPGCLAEVGACPVLGCGTLLGTADKGAPTDTELYTRVLDDAIGPPLRWSMGVCLTLCLGIGLLGAVASGDPGDALVILVLCGMTGSLLGMVIGGLIGGVRERRAFGESWRE